MKQKGRLPGCYFILLLLSLIISDAGNLLAQADTSWVRQHAETARRAYEVANKNKDRLIAEGNWHLNKMPGVVYLRTPIEAMPGMRDYGSYHIPFCFDHETTTNFYRDFFNTVNETYTHSYNGSTGTLFEYATPGYNYMLTNPARVVAAAGGVILAKGDGNFDQNCSYTPGNGNYMVIEHSDGRRTGYYHLRNGLITTKGVGDFIAEGEPIGYPGGFHGSFLQLPVRANLFFELRDAGNNPIDPFGFPYNIPPIFAQHSSWRDSTLMESLVGSSNLKYLRTMKHLPSTYDNCNEPINSYTDHFNPGDPLYIRYAITNYDVYNDSVMVTIYNPVGFPIMPTFIRPRQCVNCGSFVYLITYSGFSTNALPTNPTFMIPGTYTVVLTHAGSTTLTKTYYHYFTVGCQSSYSLTATVNVETGAIAGNTIDSYQTCNSGSRVKYVAGNEVILHPNFIAYNGSDVIIYTEPCVVPPRLSDDDGESPEQEMERLLVAPNPARDFLTFKIKDYNSKATFKIYNSTLQLVKVLNVENAAEQMISLAEFENGIYFIDAETNGWSYKSKFVVNK